MSRGQNYNCGTSFFERYQQEQAEKEHSIETDLLCQTTNKSPWQFVKSGYSSASPAGTASPGSSPNSQCYGHSSDDLSVDSLISSLLQVVNGDSYSGNSIPCDVRFSQRGGGFTNRCRDCADGLCESCLLGRQSIIRLQIRQMAHRYTRT